MRWSLLLLWSYLLLLSEARDNLLQPETNIVSRQGEVPVEVSSSSGLVVNNQIIGVSQPSHDQLHANLTQDIVRILNLNPRLAPKILRLGFHDCIGGCDGCVDVKQTDHLGLELPILALSDISHQYKADDVSRADVWALATLVAANVSQSGIDFLESFSYGRVDCEDQNEHCRDGTGKKVDCSAMEGPHRRSLPSRVNTHLLLQWFADEFDFSPEEVVAIMGAHTLGKASEINSGFSGHGWTPNPTILNNEYYKSLVGGTSRQNSATEQLLVNSPRWDQVQQAKLYQWVNYDLAPDKKLMMLNCDVSLVRDISRYEQADGQVLCDFNHDHPLRQHDSASANDRPLCPFADATMDLMATYKADNDKWLQDFRDVLVKTLQNGYQPPSSCVDERICQLGDPLGETDGAR